MVEHNEFVISFDVATGNIKLRNPHGPETDGNYMLLKKLIEGLANNLKDQTNEATAIPEGEKPMSRAELEEYHRKNLKNMVVRDAPFYKKLLEVKENSERLHAIGGEDPNTSGYYRAIAWVIKTIEEDTQKPYSEDLTPA